MTYIPFQIYIKVVPGRGLTYTDTAVTTGLARRSGRNVYVRELERLSYLVYDSLRDTIATTYSDDATIAIPGAGVTRLFGQFGSLQPGMSVVPQFGSKPSLLGIAGFYNSSTTVESDQVASNKPLIHCGKYVSGPAGQWPWVSTGAPSTNTLVEVKALKLLVENAIAGINDDTGNDLEVYSMTFKGTKWGNGGHHFPR